MTWTRKRGGGEGIYGVEPMKLAAARRIKVTNKNPKREMKATLFRNAAILEEKKKLIRLDIK